RGATTTRVGRAFLSAPRSDATALFMEPPEIHVSLDEPLAGLLLGAQAPDGTIADVTSAARYANNFSDVFEITPALQIRAKRPGRATLTAYYKGKRIEAAVIVASNTASASG